MPVVRANSIDISSGQRVNLSIEGGQDETIGDNNINLLVSIIFFETNLREVLNEISLKRVLIL